MVEDRHAEGDGRFVGDEVADLAEADDAEGVAARVVGGGCDVLVGVRELGGGGGAGGG